MASLLPQADGYLPYFLIYDGTAALIHAIFCYLSEPKASMASFSGPKRPPPTALLAHVYAVKNSYTAAIRLYAAYHISNPQLYELAMFSLIGVLFLYTTELFIWRTARLNEAIFPFTFAGSGLIWMIATKHFYLQRSGA